MQWLILCFRTGTNTNANDDVWLANSFLASAVLVVIGLYVRRRLQETPLFKLAQERDNTTASPLREVFKSLLA